MFKHQAHAYDGDESTVVLGAAGVLRTPDSDRRMQKGCVKDLPSPVMPSCPAGQPCPGSGETVAQLARRLHPISSAIAHSHKTDPARGLVPG